jgi:hypothetical protein
MAIPSGTKFGTYEVGAQIGAGGNLRWLSLIFKVRRNQP